MGLIKSITTPIIYEQKVELLVRLNENVVGRTGLEKTQQNFGFLCAVLK